MSSGKWRPFVSVSMWKTFPVYYHKWLKTKLEIDYDLFKQQCMAVNSLILDSKKTFYNDKIDSCAGDQKELFKIIDKIMPNYEEPQLPSHNSLD